MVEFSKAKVKHLTSQNQLAVFLLLPTLPTPIAWSCKDTAQQCQKKTLPAWPDLIITVVLVRLPPKLASQWLKWRMLLSGATIPPQCTQMWLTELLMERKSLRLFPIKSISKKNISKRSKPEVQKSSKWRELQVFSALAMVLSLTWETGSSDNRIRMNTYQLAC